MLKKCIIGSLEGGGEDAIIRAVREKKYSKTHALVSYSLHLKLLCSKDKHVKASTLWNINENVTWVWSTPVLANKLGDKYSLTCL
jgi:hypothetical protein